MKNPNYIDYQPYELTTKNTAAVLCAE